MTADSLPIRAVTKEQAEKSDFVVCVRVEQLPNPIEGSIRAVCSSCGSAVWVDEARMPKTPKRICLDCAKALPDRKG